MGNVTGALQQDVKLQKLIKTWQHIHSLSTSDEEKQAVKYGGKPGCVTISSVGMFARGVDIRAENLRVCAAYVPTFEDEIQIKGRTGRFGKPGDYRMLINLNDEETHYCPVCNLYPCVGVHFRSAFRQTGF